MRDTRIADELISNILQISYQGLSQKLKRVISLVPLHHYDIVSVTSLVLHHYDIIFQDVGALHQRFFDECFRRLDELQLPVDREETVTPGKTALSKAMDL